MRIHCNAFRVESQNIRNIIKKGRVVVRALHAHGNRADLLPQRPMKKRYILSVIAQRGRVQKSYPNRVADLNRSSKRRDDMRMCGRKADLEWQERIGIMETITKEQLAGMIDHTNLKAFASREDMEKLCQEARENGFAMVAVNSVQSALCRELLAGCPVHVGAAISFPLGQTSIETKVFETVNAIGNGADEIDYVVNLTEVKNGNWAYVRREMEQMTGACRERGAICKVIFENCYLTKEEIRTLAEIAREVRPDFIKTSTGFGTGGATAEDVKLMKDTVGDAVKVKAAGGIRDWESCRAMIAAGAQRIGTSAGLKILREFTDSQA